MYCRDDSFVSFVVGMEAFYEDILSLDMERMINSAILDNWAHLLNHLEISKPIMERLVFYTAVSPSWLGCTADNPDDSAEAEFLGSLESWLTMSVPSISTKKLEQVKWVIIYINFIYLNI